MKFKLPLTSIFLFLFFSFTFWNIQKTTDFQFHYFNPKGICLDGYEKSYCENYQVIQTLFNFPTQELQFSFLLYFLFVGLPIVLNINSNEKLITYFSFGFTFNLLFAFIFYQALGLLSIFYYLKAKENWDKEVIILLSFIVHRWLFVFLLISYLIERIYGSVNSKY